MSAGLSLVLTYRNSIPSASLISLILFLTNTERGFLLLIQFKTHCESVKIIFLVSVIPSSFDTNFTLLVAISAANNSNLGIDMFFFDATLDFENIRFI